MAKKVRGVGINDSITPIHTVVNGKRAMCPFYRVWSNMLDRCYGNSELNGYDSVSICEEWLTFSNFKIWMEKQDWQGKQLDKDILSKGGSKTYSPSTAMFFQKN